MRERANRGYSPWWYLLLVLFPLLAFALHFRGHMVLGWDTEPALRPLENLLQSLSAWKANAYLGQPNIFQITQAPLALIELALARAFNIVLAEKIVLTAIFVLPAFTMYYCARRLFPKEPYVWFAAGWCYALCPLLFVRFYVPIVTVQFAYAMLPLLVNVALDLERRGSSPLRLLWLAAVQIAFLPCAANLAYWIVPQGTAAGIAVLMHVTDFRRKRKPRAGVFWQAVAVVLLVNAFWFVPQVVFGVVAGSTFEHESINSAYTSGVRNDVTEGADLAYTIRMSSAAETGVGDYNGPFWTYARALENGLVAAPFYLWILLAAAAVVLRARDRRVVILGVALCFGLFVMKGGSPPFGFVLAAFYRIPLLGTIFRNGYDKLLPMVAFAFALLLPVAAVAIGRLAKRTNVAHVALLAVVLVMAFPFWTGQMFMARPKGPTLSAMPPPEAFAFARTLDDIPSRILFAPISDNPQLLATRWGFFGPNVYGRMTKAAVISMASSVMNAPGSDDIMSGLHRAIAERDVATFVLLARYASVGYVFVAHDMDANYYGGESAEQIDAFLHSVPGAHVVRSMGPYALWRLDGVGAVDGSLERLPITSFSTTFERAAAVAAQCGGARSALIPQFRGGACTITDGLGVQTGATPPPVYPARVWLKGGSLAAMRVVNPQKAVASAVALPAAVTAAQIAGNVVGPNPVVTSLLPCARYRVRPLTESGTVRIGSLASLEAEIPDIALPPLAAGLHVITIDTAASGVGASVDLRDAITGEPVAETANLQYPTTQLAFFAMPGRTYQLTFGASEGFERTRNFARSIRVSNAAFGTSTTLLAPPDLSRCRPSRLAPAFVVRPATIPSGVAVVNGTLIVHPYDATTTGMLVRVPLPPGSTIATIGDDAVGAESHDVTLPTGGPIVVRTFRSVGLTRRVPIQRAIGSAGASVDNLDRAAGTVTLQSHSDREWLRYALPLRCAKTCIVEIRASSVLGRYGVAVVDDVTGRVVTGADDVRSPAVSLIVHPSAAGRYFLYLYAITGRGTVAGVQIASVTVTPIVATGWTRFSIARVVPGLPTEADTVEVRGGNAPAIGAFDGRRLGASPYPSAIVQDTQFDPFWTTLIFRGRAPFVYFPAHAVADGYKNAWIVPAGLSGTIVHFYLTNFIALVGLCICAITLSALIARAVSQGKTAKAKAGERRTAEAR